MVDAKHFIQNFTTQHYDSDDKSNYVNNRLHM